MPSSGKTSASAFIAARAGDRILVRAGLGSGSGSARVAVGLADRVEQRSSVSLTSATIASPIGARAASSGSEVIATRLGALGQQRPGDVRVVGKDRGADDEDQVAAGQRLRQRARSRAAARRGSWGGPRGSRAGRRRWRGSRTPAGCWRSASATATSQPPLRRCRGRRPAPGSTPARGARASSAIASGSAPARPLTVRSIAALASASSTSASQSSIGIETNAGPVGGSAARCVAARQRQRHVLAPAAARSST